MKNGTWLEPGLALFRKKVRENWTEKHRNVARKIFFGRWGWTQKRLFAFDWSDTSQCQACKEEEGTEKHRLFHCPEWYEVRREIPEVFRKLEQKARTSKEWKWQRGIVEHPLSGSQWNRGHFCVRTWESEKHKSWSMPAEGSKGHVATDGSLLGNDGKWEACGWAVVQLDYDEEMGPSYGMYGFRKVSGPIKVQVDNKGIIDGLRKGEKECIKPKAGHTNLWIKIWEELHELVKRGILVEVAHVKAHLRRKKQKR